MHPIDFAKNIEAIGDACLCRPVTLWNTLELCCRAVNEKIAGDFVEAGVFKGAHPSLMSAVAMREGGPRIVHLMDSFCGIPRAGAEDDDTIVPLVGRGDPNETSGVSACSFGDVIDNLKRWGTYSRCVLHKGWFADTAPSVAKAVNKIAVLRLDGDLYHSTRDVLRPLGPLVTLGGFVIVDDYALTGCRRAVHEWLDEEGFTPKIVHVEDGGGPAWFQMQA